MRQFIKTLALSSGAVAIMAGSAQAQTGYYISGSIGAVDQASSDNIGTTGAFTTGNLGDGSTLDVASGTPYGWETDFDTGLIGAVEIGQRFDSGLRLGVEVSYSTADVDTHTDVTLGGGAIGSLDAAAIAGSPTALGVSIADVVADGQGKVSQFGVFLNAYYDFQLDGPFQPYLGVGLGYADVDVMYEPSAIPVIDGSEDRLAYQFKAGATILTDSPLELFGEFTYRASEELELSNQLFPGTLEIENQQNIFSVGARYRFE